jgi:AcrR family transcriptional regulator
MATDLSQETGRDEKTRQRIIAYAQRVFYERGFRRITVEELCAGMALSKRTFYKHFQNRDELVEAVLASFGMAIVPVIAENLLSDRPVREVLERHFQLIQEKLFGVISVTFAADLQAMMPEVWRNIEEMRGQIVALLARLVERGQREGALRPDIDAEVFGKVISRIVTTLAEPTFLISQGLTLPDVARTMRAVVLHGVVAQKEAGDER